MVRQVQLLTIRCKLSNRTAFCYRNRAQSVGELIALVKTQVGYRFTKRRHPRIPVTYWYYSSYCWSVRSVVEKDFTVYCYNLKGHWPCIATIWIPVTYTGIILENRIAYSPCIPFTPLSNRVAAATQLHSLVGFISTNGWGILGQNSGYIPSYALLLFTCNLLTLLSPVPKALCWICPDSQRTFRKPSR